MKVGLICPYNLYRGGGVQECVRALKAELEQRGHTAKIITPQPREVPSVVESGVLFVGTAAQVRSPFHTTAQVSVSVNADSLQAILDNEQFDILHFHEPWVPILSRQILARSQSVNIATFHAKLPDTVMSRTIERVITPYTRSILKDLDCLTAVSDAAAMYVKSLTDAKINIVPNGIDLEAYKRKKNSAVSKSSGVAKKHILYIGRLEKRKGVKYLLYALQQLQQTNPDVRCTIAGDGPDRQKLEQLAEQLELKHTEFIGYITEKQKHELLSASDVFCSPALYGESFGIVLLEAMAMGVPVVAGNNPGYEAVLKERGAIGIVNPKDSVEFARRLRLIIEDEDIRKLWKQWAEVYVQQFNYKTIVDQYEQLYRVAKK